MVTNLEIQGLNCREILHRHQSKATLVCHKMKMTNKAHLHQSNKVFPISIMETVLNSVLLPSLS